MLGRTHFIEVASICMRSRLKPALALHVLLPVAAAALAGESALGDEDRWTPLKAEEGRQCRLDHAMQSSVVLSIVPHTRDQPATDGGGRRCKRWDGRLSRSIADS